MEKMLAESEYERWKPKYRENFWYLSYDSLTAFCAYYDPFICSNENLSKTLNCFQTKEQAEAEAEKILVRCMLEDIARRLNKGKEIYWDNIEQHKYGIYLSTTEDEIEWRREGRCKIQGTVYCLDLNFYNVAIQEIGEERLKKYLRGE